MPWGREESVQVREKYELFYALKYAGVKNIPTPCNFPKRECAIKMECVAVRGGGVFT